MRSLLVLMALLGAGLAFVLEPMVGRLATLTFGGAVHVWTVCIMVFQGLLFAAYAWAHLVVPRIGVGHLLVLLLAVGLLPIDLVAAPAATAPIGPLVASLVLQVGLPFFCLATAGVVAQQWWARALGTDPYWLYAASNTGSLVGLLGYPLLERVAGLEAQRTLWSMGYVVFVVVVGLAWRDVRGSAPIRSVGGPAPAAIDQAKWVALAAVPSALLLAVTNTVTTELGSFPLVWVLPLALYLGSFIVAFREHEEAGWYAQLWPDWLLALALLANLAIVVAIHPWLYAAWFFVCLVMHERLYLLRPSAAHLTRFYLAIALGGWLGGAAVSLGAPLLLPDLLELPLGLLAAAGVLAWTAGLPDRNWFTRVPFQLAASRALLGLTVVAMLAGLVVVRQSKGILVTERNLYGIFQVTERTTDDGSVYRELANGSTSHGLQYRDERRAQSMSYYHAKGGNAVGLGLRRGPRMAGIGLGTGAIAALLQPGESLVFYEINPLAEKLARGWFTYLHDSAGDVSVQLGDARLVLAGEDVTYDALFVDAFSGDGIPAHLLTREAVQLYLDRVDADGIIVFHVSNRYLDLRGLLAALARDRGVHVASRYETDAAKAVDDPLYTAAATVVMARDRTRLQPLYDLGWSDLSDAPPTTLWTDDFVDVLEPAFQLMRGP